jgi:hypothetical protein
MATPDEIDLAPSPRLAWADEYWEGFVKRPPVWQRLRVQSERLRGGATKNGVTVYRKTHSKPSREAYQAFLDGADAAR